jgi:hypothetical protein
MSLAILKVKINSLIDLRESYQTKLDLWRDNPRAPKHIEEFYIRELDKIDRLIRKNVDLYKEGDSV